MKIQLTPFELNAIIAYLGEYKDVVDKDPHEDDDTSTEIEELIETLKDEYNS